MPSRSIPRSVTHVAGRVPGLRRLPVVALVGAAEVALMARDHLMQLTPNERRRLVTLVRIARGRRHRLSGSEQRELRGLLDKLEARALVGDAVGRLSPVPLPRRLLYGRGGRAR
jgi:hypothetical protein